jgi:D-ala D-ala ligase C-terminus/SET domain
MKICVLQPDFSTSDVDYQHYAPPRNLSKWLPNDTVEHVFLNKLTTYQQLKQLKKANYDIYVNLCESYLDWSVPSIDVIHTFDLLNLPYTGPTASLYDPPKPLMKYIAYCAGVQTPHFAEINPHSDVASQVKHLNFPLFVKPAKAGDSLGIDDNSLVNNVLELENKIKALLEEEYDDILVEEYIAGREFTVLVAANANNPHMYTTFVPIEYRFPEDRKFKTYAMKTSELHTDVNFPCDDPILEQKLRNASEKIFIGFSGVGYGRMDFRVDAKGEIYFLEVNFTCSVFFEDGYEASADYILQYDPMGKAGFLKHIIEEGIARHGMKQKKYDLKGNSLNGYGIFANRLLKKHEVVFQIEGSAQRIITKRYVEKNWNAIEKETFKHYAYPISKEVYILWDENPDKWAPQNHSCQPNTHYDGLNLIASHDIQKGDELTLDYAYLLDDTIAPFQCTCGSTRCRKIVKGTRNNSITTRETKAWKAPII